MRGASTNCFYKRLFRLAGNERLKTQADQTQAHAHAAGAMALDGLGLARRAYRDGRSSRVRA